jgi:MFS superfamily sulfate permease-like transporter
MLAAIGIILISKQIPLALGYDQPDFWTSGFLKLFSHEHILGNLSTFSSHITSSVIIISFLSLLILIVFQMKFAEKLKIIPAPLLVVIVGILFDLLFSNLGTWLNSQTNSISCDTRKHFWKYFFSGFFKAIFKY